MKGTNKTDIQTLMVSSRVRLARNIVAIPFKTKEVDAFAKLAATIKKHNPNFVSTRISAIDQGRAVALYEQHLISRELLENTHNGMIVMREIREEEKGRVIVMLGEEDHVRIQVIEVGLNLKIAYDLAKKIADNLATEHQIAFSPNLGYLTSCPTNLGTAMRASVMLFLPALTITNQIHAAVHELRGMNLTVRGVYGEGSDASGYMYQISNQACLGLSEQEILEKVESTSIKIAELELKLQQQLFNNNPDEIINQVMRSLGLLTHAHMISSEEAGTHLAWLKLGDCLGLLKFKPRSLDDLFFITKPATLSTQNNCASDIISRDKIRAKKIADVLRTSRVK